MMEVSQEVLHEIVERVLKGYPTISFLMSHEDKDGALVTLRLTGYKAPEAVAPIPEYVIKAFEK